MEELERFLEQFGFVIPELMAPLCVWAQFLCSIAFILGLLTRWAGVVTTFVFLVGVWMVHWPRFSGLVARAHPRLPRNPVCDPWRRTLRAGRLDCAQVSG